MKLALEVEVELVVKCQEILVKFSDLMLIPIPDNWVNYEVSISNPTPRLKETVTYQINKEYLERNYRMRVLIM